jgi:hypothetical protein
MQENSILKQISWNKQSNYLSGEATHTNVIVFGLTRPGFESTIYHTRGEHANHYANDGCIIYMSILVLSQPNELTKNQIRGRMF